MYITKRFRIRITKMLLILLLLIQFFETREINVYGNYGLITVDLDQNEIVITNGKKEFPIALKYHSKLGPNSLIECQINFDVNNEISITRNSTFKDTGTQISSVSKQNTDLEVQHKRYENEFINSTNEFFRSHFFCNRGRLSCGKMPITGETLRTTMGVTAEYQLVNCHGENTGISPFFGKYVNEEAYCCSINLERWEHPQRQTEEVCSGIEHGAAMARVWIKANRRATFATDSGRMRATEIDRYCFYDPDRRFKRSIPDSSNGQVDRTSNTVFSGGIISDKLIMIDKISSDEFIREFQRLGERVLAIEGDKSVREALEKQVCRNENKISADFVNSAFYASQAQVKAKMENTLSACENNIVPQIFSDHTLSLICNTYSTNKICSTHAVRDLFTCKALQPSFETDYLFINLMFTLNVPISENYSALRLYTVPMYMSADQYRKDVNITHVAKKAEELMNSQTGSDLVALKNILSKVMSSKRRRRSMVSIYYKIELDDLPEILTQHENDVIAFDLEKCSQIHSVIICDFVNHNQNSANCLTSILRTESENIEKICPFKITSTETDCQVKQTEYAQIVSTTRQIPIMKAGNNGIYHEKADDHCESICAISNTNYVKMLECGSRKYETQINDGEIEVIEVITTKLNEHNIINAGVNLDELDQTGYKMVDKILLQKTNRHFNNITHLLVMAIVGVGSFTFGSKIAISSGFILTRWIKKFQEKVIYRGYDANRAKAHNIYLNLKKLQEREKKKIMCA